MDVITAFSSFLLTVFSIVIAVIALIYQRRQTTLAEEARQHVTPPHHVDHLQRMFETKSLRIGYLHYPPFSIAPLDDSEPPQGYYVDLIRTLCESNDIVPVFQHVRFGSAISTIMNHELDVVVSIFQTPRRAQTVDFTCFLHSVAVSGITRSKEERISSQSDLVDIPFTLVVCRDEIGHEILEDQLKIPHNRMIVIDTSNIADIVEMVSAKKADVAIADSLSCYHALAARGAEGPRLRPILRRHPIGYCPNGFMVGKNQKPLANWIETGIKTLRKEERFRRNEDAILEEFHGVIGKI